MRAVQFHRYGGPEVLQLDEVPTPAPGPGHVVVAVEATAVHPADLVARSGGFAGIIPARDVYRPGWDFYGRVHTTGSGVTDLNIGDPVIGTTDWLRDLNGTHAQYVHLPRSGVIVAPVGVEPASAAALPINALTAAQALDLLDLTIGDTLVVIGTAGAVGGFAMELAIAKGLRVLGVAGAGDEEFVRTRGAAFIRRDAQLATEVRAVAPDGADAVFDTASLGAPALAAIRDGGTYCGVIYPYAPTPERDITVTTVGVHSDAATLTELAWLAAAGTLTLRVAAQYPLSEAALAHQHLAKGGSRGAVLLRP